MSSKYKFLSEIAKLFVKRIAVCFKNGIEESRESIQTSEIYTNETTHLKRGEKYTHINSQIRNSIESSCWIGQTLTFNIHSKKITVHLVHPCSSVHKDSKKISLFFKKIEIQIFAWLYVASLESEKGCSTDLSIYIYFTDFKKTLPPVKKTPLDEINVNTGFTFSCKLTTSGENEMYIYRKEEWFKVLIHESFHAFSLDYLGLSSEVIENIDRKVIQFFPLHINLRYYESYCEMWAELLQIIYMNWEELSQNEKPIWSKFERMLKIDQKHSVKQAVKILKQQHICYSDLFEKSNKSQLKRMEYREVSPVFSYYLIKSIFYMHIGRYIEWTSINNKGTLRFQKSEHSVNSYVELLRQMYQSPKFIEEIKSCEKTLKIDGGENNLRMSYWQA